MAAQMMGRLEAVPDNSLEEVLASLKELEEEMLEEMSDMEEGSKELGEALRQYQDLQEGIAYIEGRMRKGEGSL
ncbi:MAG: hypothetical protein M1421_00030 [Candidatus Eremiobacteraeota bacterium]|nr:hypothetical protein [Candidatus Eremiobacteraeota bacterium]